MNEGWTYTQRVHQSNISIDLLEFLTSNYRHSSQKKWKERLNKGELRVNNKKAITNLSINQGDLISWLRPPWEEPEIPSSWNVIFDNQDVLIINKPSGIPTTPGGGFLKHTLTELIKERYKEILPRYGDSIFNRRQIWQRKGKRGNASHLS